MSLYFEAFFLNSFIVFHFNVTYVIDSNPNQKMKNLIIQIAQFDDIKEAKTLKEVCSNINNDRDFQFKKYHKLFTGLDPVDDDEAEETIDSMIKAVSFINNNLDLVEGQNEQNAIEVEEFMDELQDERFRNTLVSILKSIIQRFRYPEKDQSKKLFLISTAENI